MKIALLHDHLYQAGGAERVLYALHRLYPEAPIYTVIYNRRYLKGFEQCRIHTSFIQNLPFGTTHFKWYLPLMPAAIEELDLSAYDVVVSSASALIKGVITGPRTTHICYCHTPTRYLWSDTHLYRRGEEIPAIARPILPLLLHRLRSWDQIAAQRVDHYIANSSFVAHRIKSYYGRESSIVYPPVDTHRYSITPRVGNYFLIVSRLRPYKRVDIAIAAFNKLHLPLKIVGVGEDYTRLKAMSKPNIEFLGGVSDEEKAKLMSECRAFIHPQEEDFGMTAVEAMAAGRPVIAYAAGGALETVVDGTTGILVEDQSWEALVDAVLHFQSESFNPVAIKAHADRFSVDAFSNSMRELVTRHAVAHTTVVA